MAASLLRTCAALAFAAILSGCGRATPAASPHAPQTSGTLQVHGLHAPVTIVRDTWGIPHITAGDTDDLFFAQGFVQAQDRLFQIDLWKRSVEGHLAEVLGANFIQRDSMTRRIQFRGDLDREWASYGPEVHRIATAFTSGINAWVRIARTDLPEEFALAGWAPEFWRPEDLLNRTDAFLASGDALDDLFRARLIAAVGERRANELFPPSGGSPAAPANDVDLGAITYVVPDAVRRIGTPPFFLALNGKVTDARRPSQQALTAPTPQPASGAGGAAGPVGARVPARRGRTWLFDSSDTGAAAGAAGPAVGISLESSFAVPSSRYLVHLSAPGWNVIGATAPWLPGIVAGHNERVAWAMTPVAADTQDVFVERVNPANSHQVQRDGRWVDMSVDYERVDVKGRNQPVQYERQYTPSGVVVAQDKERGLVYTLRWSGTEPGGAGELAAVSLDRAGSAQEFAEALSRWKMPVAAFVYADADGAVGSGQAGLLPVRPAGAGHVPEPAWSNDRIWRGFEGSPRPMTATHVNAGDAQRQRAVVAQGVEDDDSPDLVRMLGEIGRLTGDLETARDALLESVRSGSNSVVYQELETALRQVVAGRSPVPEALRGEFAERMPLSRLLEEPRRLGLTGDQREIRTNLLVDALKVVAGQLSGNARAALPTVTFEHPLAVSPAARRRFNVGPVTVQGNAARAGTLPRTGAVFQGILAPGDPSRSVAANAPGESGSASSPHYDDLAAVWGAGDYIGLLFDQRSIAAKASETLVLQPR